MAKNCLQCRTHGFNSWVRKIPWRRKWKPTPVLTGKPHRQMTLAGYSPWGCKESDITQQLNNKDIYFYKIRKLAHVNLKRNM